jgi:uncharacterized protein (UPF0264 family)
MTRSLVSVRSLGEARLAAAAGVDLIDLKEPRRGSLGSVGLALATQVADLLGGKGVLSMALGELAEWTKDDWKLADIVRPGIKFAKIGLARLAMEPKWRVTWTDAIRRLPSHCSSVAVIYADWQSAAAPRPGAILDEAVQNGCRALLVDTFHKHTGNVFSHCSAGELADVFGRARNAGMLTVLAGSLRLDDLEAALILDPDYIAVRGAVCRDSREGEICPAKLAEWLRRLNGNRNGQDLAGGWPS